MGVTIVAAKGEHDRKGHLYFYPVDASFLNTP